MVGSPLPTNTDVFDILLPEGIQEDSGVTPQWHVEDNSGSLYGLVGGAIVDPNPNKIYKAADGARPVITYTLAALGSNKAYVHFSSSSMETLRLPPR